jgi:hypothetical protein
LIDRLIDRAINACRSASTTQISSRSIEKEQVTDEDIESCKLVLEREADFA